MATPSPDGRRLLRLEVRNAQTPIERKPPWIKTRAVMGPQYHELRKTVADGGLHTVCQEAGCPNIYECWEDREATFLIGGDQCTRRCDFCQIDTGRPEPLDLEEPAKVAADRGKDGPSLRHRDGRRARRPGGPGRVALRPDGAGDPCNGRGVRRGGADPGLQR